MTAGAAPPAKPTAADAKAFIEAAEGRLLELGNRQQQTSWVQSTYITEDTKKIAAHANTSSMETLHHASISRARFVVCTLTDSVLKGTSNLRMLMQLRSYCPDAGLVMASETIAGSLELYQAGADFVFIPRMHSAHRMAEVLRTALEDGLGVLRREEMASLRSRDEVLA
jgi:voltage-gated potassium channel Kch